MISRSPRNQHNIIPLWSMWAYSLFRIIPHPPKFTCLELCCIFTAATQIQQRCYSADVYVLTFITFDCNSLQQITDFISHMLHYCWSSIAISYFAQCSILLKTQYVASNFDPLFFLYQKGFFLKQINLVYFLGQSTSLV